ncbi:MAG: IS66 family insertion sequence element accessory protein TnpB [Bacteroidales bacterium]
MFALTPQHRFYFYTLPCDMRKSFFTLSGLVRDTMGKDPENGDVYIFINRQCTSMKLLHMKNGGFVIYHKKLNSGYFKLPGFDPMSHSFSMTYNDLAMLVDGFTAENLTTKKDGFLLR